MYRVLRWAGPVVIGAAVTIVWADDAASPGQQLKALREALLASDRKFVEDHRTAKTDEERAKAEEASLDRRIEIARQVIAIAEKAPDTPGAAEALVLAFETTRPG